MVLQSCVSHCYQPVEKVFIVWPIAAYFGTSFKEGEEVEEFPSRAEGWGAVEDGEAASGSGRSLSPAPAWIGTPALKAVCTPSSTPVTYFFLPSRCRSGVLV